MANLKIRSRPTKKKMLSSEKTTPPLRQHWALLSLFFSHYSKSKLMTDLLLPVFQKIGICDLPFLSQYFKSEVTTFPLNFQFRKTMTYHCFLITPTIKKKKKDDLPLLSKYLQPQSSKQNFSQIIIPLLSEILKQNWHRSWHLTELRAGRYDLEQQNNC